MNSDTILTFFMLRCCSQMVSVHIHFKLMYVNVLYDCGFCQVWTLQESGPRMEEGCHCFEGEQMSWKLMFDLINNTMDGAVPSQDIRIPVPHLFWPGAQGDT